MCGIAGSFGPAPPGADRVEAALAALGRRGPDARGTAERALGNAALTLVHTRLSIIDLDARANQPFARDGCVVVYNGEIYNYLELRLELGALGHRFQTTSDTEVLLAAYREWGEACLDRFEGMWAFALLDEREGRLLLSRDRFGEKPLYTWWLDGTLYFASEPKALFALAGRRPAVNAAQIRRFLVNGYKSLHKDVGGRRQGFFAEIEEFPAAHVARLTRPGRPEPRPYWRLAYAPRPMSREDAVAGVAERLADAVRLRLRADVPLAFCLSGGVDSSLLAGMAAKRLGQSIHCFSIIDKDPRYDESDNIAATEAHLGCRVTRIPTSSAGFLERMARLVAYHDQPVATINYYMHSFISEAVAGRGYKVAVSGTAADELFSGYYDHALMWLAEMRDAPDFESLVDDWRRGLGAHVRNPLLKDPLAFVADPKLRRHVYLDAERFAGLLAEPFDEPFAEGRYSDNLLRNRMMNELFHESIPVILDEDDRNSMLFSVENRSPYLDRRLAEFAYAIPPEHLVAGGLLKWPLRAAGAGLVPDSVRLDARKRGFNAAIDSVLDRRDAKVRAWLLDASPIFALVNRGAFEQFLDGDLAADSASKFLFSFVSAKTFLESAASG